MTDSNGGYAPHPYVGGRAAALRELTAWRAGSAQAPRVLVLTGSPGAGASRLLTGFLMLCDPEFRATLPLADLDPSTVPPDLPPPATPSAQGLTASQVLWLLADHHELAATRSEDVFTALAALDAPVTVVVPDVDLAGPVRAAGEPARLVREVLRPLAATPTVRLLTEVPRDLVADLVDGLPEGVARVLDLDESPWTDPDGLVLQVATALDPALGAPEVVWTQDPESREELARAVARSSGGNRLTARLAVESLLTVPESLDLDAFDDPDAFAGKVGLPTSVAEALDGHATRLGTDPVLLRAVLAPLALAEGEGLPVQLWAPLAGAVAGTDLSAVLADAARLAGPFVHLAEAEPPADAEAATGGGADAEPTGDARTPDAADPGDAPRVLARLTHPAVAAELRAGLDVATAQRQVAAALLAAVPEQDWSRADPYVRDHVAAHTLDAGLLPRLLTDPGLFVHADPVVLRAAVEAVPPETLDPPARTYLRTAPLLTRTEVPAPIRAALLETAFVQDGLPRFAEALHTLGLDLPWRTLWNAPVAGVTGLTVGSAAPEAPADGEPPDRDADAARAVPAPRAAPDEAAAATPAAGAEEAGGADGELPVGVLVVPPGTPGARRLEGGETELLVLGLAGAEVVDVDPARVSRPSEEERAVAALTLSRGADYVRIWDRRAQELVAALFSDVPFTAVDLSPDGVLLVATERGVTALSLSQDG